MFQDRKVLPKGVSFILVATSGFWLLTSEIKDLQKRYGESSPVISALHLNSKTWRKGMKGMVFGFKAVVSYEKLQPKWWFSDWFFPDFLKQLLLCIVLVYLSFFSQNLCYVSPPLFFAWGVFLKKAMWRRSAWAIWPSWVPTRLEGACRAFSWVGWPSYFCRKVVEDSEFAKNFWADLKNNSTIKEFEEPQDISRKFLLNHPWTVENNNPKTPNINKTTKHRKLIRCLLGERFNQDWRVDGQPYTIPKTVLLSEILCIVILEIQTVGIKIQVRKGLHTQIYSFKYTHMICIRICI